tara:strand:- start:355 stop:537 length:183 start_codon:yes stop_codon:yes gene_type:complete
MILLTKQQRASLHRKWQQNNQGMTYREFRKTVQPAIGMDCVLVEWSGMWLGIEQDGYTHS